MRTRFYAVAASVLVLDHLTKWLVRRMDLPSQSVTLIPDLLRLSYVENTGVAFGLFSTSEYAWKPYILAAMAVVAVVVILIYSSRMPANRVLLQYALAITLGGILGNFTDRIVRGYVVDFIELHYKEMLHWPTFNVADSAITVGIAMLLIDTVKNPEMEEELQSQ